MDQHAWLDKTTPLQSAWSVALSTMMVECEQFIYLLIYQLHLQTFAYNHQALSEWMGVLS